jgi:hypothetical protein
VSADEVLWLEKIAATKWVPIKNRRKRHPKAAFRRTVTNRRLYRQLQSIEKLPKRDQEALLRTTDAFLTKAS